MLTGMVTLTPSPLSPSVLEGSDLSHIRSRLLLLSKAGADIGTDRSFAWAVDNLILAL
jgi:hypothetical protein